MSALDEGGEEGPFGELVAERADLGHAQVREEVLEPEDVVKKLRLGEPY